MPNRVQIRFIKDALDSEEKLNDWERGLIDSLAEKDDSYILSDTQNDMLNKIQRVVQD